MYQIRTHVFRRRSTLYTYDAAGQLLTQITTDPTNTPSKTSTHRYTYDAKGNIITEFRSGTSGQERFNLVHSYDALNRLIGTRGDQGFRNRTYQYDSLGNLIYELDHNKGTEYWHNNLNQITRRLEDDKDNFTYSFDNRGNLIEVVYHQNNNHRYPVEPYVYDSANRMVSGRNADDEESRYTFNGLGHLVATGMTIRNNNYGYTGNEVEKSYVMEKTYSIRHLSNM